MSAGTRPAPRAHGTEPNAVDLLARELLVDAFRRFVGVYHSPNPENRRGDEADYNQHQGERNPIEYDEHDSLPNLAIIDLAQTREEE